jgi:hypothetical protein
MISDKAKAAILDKCCQKVDCLARGEVIDLEGALDASQTSPVTDSEKLRLLCEAGYDPNEAHPECYRGFSYVKFFELCGGYAQTPDQWRPIETAPTDGTWVLVWETGINTKYHPSEIARFRNGRWKNSALKCVNAVAWQLLPVGPASPDTSTLCKSENGK